MKKTIILMLSILTVGFFWNATGSVSSAATWNETKNVTITEGAFTYDAYLSEDGKESWIHKLTVNPETGDEKVLNFPEKVEGATVTKLGNKPEANSDIETNIVGTHIETYHGGTGATSQLEGIEEIRIPKTVNELTCFVFSGFYNVKKVNIPAEMTELPSAAFYGCSSLKEIDIPANLKKIGYQVFGKCKSLKVLKFGSELKELSQAHLKNTSITKLTISKKNPYLSAKKGVVYNKKGTRLYAVLPTVKSVYIGKKVNSIVTQTQRDNSQYFSYLSESVLDLANKKVTISKKNKVFAKKGKCIYNKKSGNLLYYMASSKDIKIAEGVTKLQNVKYGKNTQYSNKITLPKSLKKLDLSAIHVLENYLYKIEFKSKVTISNKFSIANWGSSEKVTIVVPKKLKNYYTKQFRKYKKYCRVVVKG